MSTIAVELVDGIKVVVPNSLEHITSYVLQEQGDWFEDEIKFLRGLIEPGDTVVDVGANYGVYALSLAKKVGPSGQVWAFEPAANTAGLLAESASANALNWLKVVQKALSNREGIAWLQTPGQSELNSLASLDSQSAASVVGPGEDVQVSTLDACLQRFKWANVDFLKIDAEGEEERILLGGVRFFQALSPLVMFEVKAGIELHLDLVARFEEIGYQCFYLVPGLDVLLPFDPADGVDGYLLNLFAAKPERIKRLAAAGKLLEHAERVQVYEKPDYESWICDVKNQPYVRSLSLQWDGTAAQPEQSAIRQALAFWRASQDCSSPIARRYVALAESFALLKKECQPECPSTRWASLARVAMALGMRQVAMQAVNMLLHEVQFGGDVLHDEPFLCPDPHFETVDTENRINDWLEAAGLSAAEKFGSYSGFFTGASAVPRLKRLAFLEFGNDVIQRRIDLVNKRFGTGPVSDAISAERPPSRQATQPSTASASLQQNKQHAMELIGSERYGEAQQIYEQLLGSGQADAQVYANLAALYQIGGRSAESIPLLERAIALQPAYPEALLNLGNALQTDSRSEEAITAFRQAIALNAALPEAHTGLGVALQDRGQLQEAIDHHREALRLRPAYAAAWSNLGVALRSRGDCRQEAIAACREALRLKPAYPEALSNLGLALLADGQSEAGLACQRQAIALNPNLPYPHLHLGDGLRELHRLPEAITVYRTAIQCKPDEAGAYAGLALALQELGDLEQGLLVAEQGLAIRPDWLPIHWSKIKILDELRRPDEALAASEALLQLQPDNALGYLVQGSVLETLKRYDEADVALDHALKQDPSLSEAYYCRGWMRAGQGETQAAIDAYRKALELKPGSYEAGCALIFTELFRRGEKGERIRAEAEQFWARFPAPVVAPFPPRASVAAQALAADAPIRLLLLSGDIGDHAVSCFLEPLLRGLDRRRFQLVLALSHRRREARARDLEQLADGVVDLTGLGEAEAVALLRRQGCAVLIETSGWTAHNRLAVLRHRVAPVQCHYVGFCGSTGLVSMDYMIGDAVLTPPQLQNQFTERLWTLPRCWSTYAPTFTPPPLTDRLEGAPFTFGSFNNLLKFTDRCADFWAAALQAVPAAQMLIKDGKALEPSVQGRVRRQLQSRGVAPERLSFIGHVADWHAHMDLYNRVDIAFDTTPMTSATTGFEALCMGVPLLAIQSDWMGGRMSSSALTALGREDWISREPAAFAAQAAELAASSEREPNQLKRQLHRQVRASVLWDGSSLCRALEQAFEQMLQQCASGSS